MIQKFVHALPPSRLGILHPSLASFYVEAYKNPNIIETASIIKTNIESFNEIPEPNATSNPKKEVSLHQPALPAKNKKEYTLIMITESCNKRILLGLKNRGFGTGFYNSFGGKIDPSDPSIAHGAVRELKEETNISVPLTTMEKSYLGKLDFTFEDNDKQMLIHFFHVDVICTTTTCSSSIPTVETATTTTRNTDSSSSMECPLIIDPNIIKPPDDGEITPKWFDNWLEVPLYMMHADDSIWLPKILQGISSPSSPKSLNGWFHFAPGSTEVNSILHYYFEFC